ncbi:MAG: (d)CMP kinase [Ilumatobacter sp.]
MSANDKTMSAAPEPRERPTPGWRDFLALTKPGVVMLLMVTAVAGMFLATDPPGMVPLDIFIPAFVGLSLAMMASAAINQIMDQKIDAIMKRTEKRPLVAGKISPKAAVTFAVLRRVVDPRDEEAVLGVAQTVEMTVGEERVMVDGVDATREIRGREVTSAVSSVAANPAVRSLLVDAQRSWVVTRGGGVVEGRDIGTVVFPDADLKLFVTASPRVRAERRVAEAGGDVDEMEASIIERDRLDSTRETSPLAVDPAAVTLDTSGLSIDEVVAAVVAEVEARSVGGGR